MPRAAASGVCDRHGLPGDGGEVDDLVQRLAPELDPRQLQELVDDAGEAVGLADQLGREAGDDLRLVLVGQRLGQQRDGADRRLQLVADVGDEIRPHRVQADPLAGVLDGAHGPDLPAVHADHRTAHQQRPAGRPVDLERVRPLPPRQRILEVRLDGLVEQGVEVGDPEEVLGLAVAREHAALGVDQHDAGGQDVERRASAPAAPAPGSPLGARRRRELLAAGGRRSRPSAGATRGGSRSLRRPPPRRGRRASSPPAQPSTPAASLSGASPRCAR